MDDGGRLDEPDHSAAAAVAGGGGSCVGGGEHFASTCGCGVASPPVLCTRTIPVAETDQRMWHTPPSLVSLWQLLFSSFSFQRALPRKIFSHLQYESREIIRSAE